MKKLFKALIIFLVVMVAIILIGYILRQSSWYGKRTYPLKYEEYIVKYSKEYSLDPCLVAAVIWTESRFNPEATSPKDAMGLMQITPQTGMWGAKTLGVENFEVEDLYDVELNIRVGCWYIKTLKQQFNDDLELVLAAYNGGSGNVSKWLKDSQYSNDGKTLYYIPFRETREYVSKVIAAYEQYKKLYDIG